MDGEVRAAYSKGYNSPVARYAGVRGRVITIAG